MQILLVLIIILSLSAGHADVELVRNGQPVAVIVDGGAPEGCTSAAGELRKYVKRISGAELQIVTEPVADGANVFVGGDAAFARLGQSAEDLPLGRDGFVIRAVGDDLVLAGGRNIATLFAVYDLLEDDLGCHWFWPGEIGEVVPDKPTIRLGTLDRVERPSFPVRSIGSDEWALKNRMNVHTNEPDGFNIHWFVHTWLRLVPPDEYADEHPEYYSEVGGARLDPRQGRLVNLCTTNPEVAKAAARTIDRIVTENPRIDMISVDPEDTQAFCRCAECQAQYDDPELPYELRNSRRVFDFTNRVADLVGEKHPDLIIKTIAYHSYVRPPADADWRPRRNVGIQFCRFMCHNHALADPTCPDNRGFDAWYREWRERTDQVLFYEYYWKVSWVGLPWPINRMLRADLPRFRDDSLLGIATQFSTNYATNGLGYWLGAKLTWDADADVDALLDTYYREFFRKTSGPVRAYYERLDRAAEASGVHLAGQRPYTDILALFAPELAAQLDEHLQEAAALAKTDETRLRVEMLRAAVTYTELVRDYLTTIREAFGPPEANLWSGMNPTAPDDALKAGAPRAEAIREFLALPENALALDQPNGYTELLLNPQNAVRYLYEVREDEIVLTKRRWLEAHGRAHSAGEPPATFAIWVYGNDLDFIDDKPEHAVALKGPDGEWEVVGGVGNTQAIGDRRNVCFVIPGIDTDRYLRGEEMELQFENTPGGPYASRAFGFWLMPDEPRLSPQDATTRIETDIDSIRSASAGFTEYGYAGFMSHEDGPITVPIEFLGFPAK